MQDRRKAYWAEFSRRAFEHHLRTGEAYVPVARSLSRRALLGGLSAAGMLAATGAHATDVPFTTFAYPATGGSANRTDPDRWADYANILEYGADNTGTNDCSAALNSAMTSGKGRIVAPAGTYKFTEGINVDALGGNGTFILEGAGNGTVFTASMDDFIFRKVLRNTGSAGGSRAIRGIKFNNTKSTLASAITTINGASWSASITGGNLNGQPGVTVTLSAPHGYTVGQSRLMNIASVSPSGYNGLVGCYFDGASSFQYHLDVDPGSYVSGGSYAPRGGGVSMIAYYGGGLYDCDMAGYYAYYGAQDCTVKLYNCNGNGAGGIGVGFWMGGESAVFGFDVTGFGTAILAEPSGCVGLGLHGGRVEINGNGIDLSGASKVKVDHTTFEANSGDAIVIHGSGSITLDTLSVHGTAANSSVNGLHATGSVNQIQVQNTNFDGDFSGNCITFDSGVLSGSYAIRFRSVGLSNSHGAPGTGLLSYPVSTVAIQSDDGTNFTPNSTVANRPADAYCLEGDLWLFTDGNTSTFGADIVAAGSGSTRVIGRFSSNGTKWTVVALAP
jgi:hypothetical protein